MGKQVLYNIGLLDTRTHNKLIVRVWADSPDEATAKVTGLLIPGTDADEGATEYQWRYTKPDTFFTK